jgi:hypothetical protein
MIFLAQFKEHMLNDAMAPSFYINFSSLFSIIRSLYSVYSEILSASLCMYHKRKETYTL